MNFMKTLPLIAVIGADGSGKSTVIETISTEFKHKKFDNIFVLKRPRKITQKRRPRQAIQNYSKPDHNYLYSVVKLIIRTAIWLWQYYTKISPFLKKRTLVIADHFYFAMLTVNPRKYRYGGPLWFSQKISQIVPRPDVYILLDADGSVLYNRKPEMSEDETHLLAQRNREFIKEQKNSFIINAEQPIEVVLSNTITVFEKILSATQKN